MTYLIIAISFFSGWLACTIYHYWEEYKEEIKSNSAK